MLDHVKVSIVIYTNCIGAVLIVYVMTHYILRYYFLVRLKKLNGEVDMLQLSRKSKQFVFLSTVVSVFIAIVFRFIFAWLLFGSVDTDEFIKNKGLRKAAYVVLMLAVTNVSDFISIVIYLHIRMSLNKLVQENNPNQHMKESVVECHEVHTISNRQNFNNSLDSEQRDVDAIRSEPLEAWSDLNNSISSERSPAQLSNSKNDAAVAMALEMHVSSGLVDAFVPLLGLISVDQRLPWLIVITIFMTSWWPIILTFRTHSMVRKMMNDGVEEVFNKISTYSVFKK